jgi:aspartate kinase
MAPLRAVKELHRATAQELGVDSKTVDNVEALLAELTQLLVGVSITQELTPRARDSLVSFGERLSTRLFAAFLRASGVPARNVDAWDAGLTTCDDFGSANVDYEASLPALRAALSPAPKEAPVAIFTGFLGRAAKTKAITTLGRGGSDLTCTLLGAALGLPEVQVWKDVDGVLTADPRLVKEARAVGALTYDEATELAFFGAAVLHPLAMQPAIQASLAANGNGNSDSSSSMSRSSSVASSSGSSSGGSNGNGSGNGSGAAASTSFPFVPTPLAVRVKNSYNRMAPGTIIAADRDMSSSLVTSVVLKDHVTLVDMVSTAAPGQVGFLANVFAAFRDCGVSVDVVATSEISVSLTLDPSRVWERELVDSELDALLSSLSRFAAATATRNVGCVSLICNVARTAEILERAFGVLKREEIPVLMMSQGASKTNISLIVGGEGTGPKAIRALHAEFFE